MRIIFKKDDREDAIFIKEIDELEIFENKGQVVIPFVFKGNPCEVKLNTNINTLMDSIKSLDVLDLSDLVNKYNSVRMSSGYDRTVVNWFCLIGDMGDAYLHNNFSGLYKAIHRLLDSDCDSIEYTKFHELYPDNYLLTVKEKVIDYCGKAFNNGEVRTFRMYHNKVFSSPHEISDVSWNDTTKAIKFRYWFESLDSESKKLLCKSDNKLKFLLNDLLTSEQVDELLCTYSVNRLVDTIFKFN